jgi:hypothetical protein
MMVPGGLSAAGKVRIMRRRITTILQELRTHAPFTLFGAVTGIAAMLLFAHASPRVSHRLFQVFHPSHVILSAVVTASLFRLYEKRMGFLAVLIVGYVGAVGVATVSDCILPFFGESILGVAVPTHADEHSQPAEPAPADQADHDEHEAGVRTRLHLGFIEDWYLVNPAALLGVVIAWFWPRTKVPHAGHILISTWASSFHMLMNTRHELSGLLLLGALVVLFIAVWLPCCVSDIVFPMLFVRAPHLHVAHDHHAQEVHT